MDNTHLQGQRINKSFKDIKKMDKIIQIAYKTYNKMNNIISSNIEHFNEELEREFRS